MQRVYGQCWRQEGVLSSPFQPYWTPVGKAAWFPTPLWSAQHFQLHREPLLEWVCESHFCVTHRRPLGSELCRERNQGLAFQQLSPKLGGNKVPQETAQERRTSITPSPTVLILSPFHPSAALLGSVPVAGSPPQQQGLEEATGHQSHRGSEAGRDLQSSLRLLLTQLKSLRSLRLLPQSPQAPPSGPSGSSSLS